MAKKTTAVAKKAAPRTNSRDAVKPKAVKHTRKAVPASPAAEAIVEDALKDVGFERQAKLAAVADPAPAVDAEVEDMQLYADSNGVPRVPELQLLYLQTEKAPVVGYSHYFIISQNRKRTMLLHPFTLQALQLPTLDCTGGKEQPLDGSHGFSAEKISMFMERKLKEYADSGRQHPAQLVRRVIAALRGTPVSDVPDFKADRPKRAVPAAFRERSERRPGVIDHIKGLIERAQGATKDEIVKELVATFPDRAEKGMRHTVDCQLRQLPVKLQCKVVFADEQGRGKVFRMVGA